MESTILDNLPTEVITIMGSLFEKGNNVKNFKLVKNSHGFSINYVSIKPTDM